MPKVGQVKEIYEMKGAGRPIPGDCRELGRRPEHGSPVPEITGCHAAQSTAPESIHLDPHTEYVDRRLDDGLENCVVLHRELRGLGYDRGCSILKPDVSPKRRRRQPDAMFRLETTLGERAQVDCGSLAEIGHDGRKHRILVIVKTLG